MEAVVSPMVKVYYGKPMLPDVSRVLVCLYEKEINFKLVDMYKGQHMPADILKLQILEQYASMFQRSMQIMGTGTFWAGILKTEEQSFNPPSWALVFHLAFTPLINVAEPDQSLITQNEQILAKVLDVYEHRLRESKYLAGDEFTLADLSHLPNAHYLANSKEWSSLFNLRKNVQRWWDKISSQPSWAKVVEMLNEIEDQNKTSVAEDIATIQEVPLQQLPSVSSGSPPLKITSSVTQSNTLAKTSPETAPIESTSLSSAPQTSLGTSVESTALPEPITKPTLEQKSSTSSTSEPDSTIDQQKSPKASTTKPNSQSEPTTQTTPQPKQGDSSTGQPSDTT